MSCWCRECESRSRVEKPSRGQQSGSYKGQFFSAWFTARPTELQVQWSIQASLLCMLICLSITFTSLVRESYITLWILLAIASLQLQACTAALPWPLNISRLKGIGVTEIQHSLLIMCVGKLRYTQNQQFNSKDIISLKTNMDNAYVTANSASCTVFSMANLKPHA